MAGPSRPKKALKLGEYKMGSKPAQEQTGLEVSEMSESRSSISVSLVLSSPNFGQGNT